MTSEHPPVETIAKLANQVSFILKTGLQCHLSLLQTPPSLSVETKRQITKRVPPSTLEKYLNPEAAISLLAMEVEDLGSRIFRYQYIERYREHFQSPDAAMQSAFVMHTHILRGSEIYIIMENCVSFLDFYYDVANDLTLNPSKKSKELTSQFKKHFKRHLLERHRIVHSHERPSLVSRMISMPQEGMADPDMTATIAEFLKSSLEILAPAIEGLDNINDFSLALEQINNFRLKAVDQECLDMWSILLDATTKLIDLSKLLKGDSEMPKNST